MQSWDETARFNNFASQTEHIIGPAAAAPAAPAPTALLVRLWYPAKFATLRESRADPTRSDEQAIT